MTEEILNPIVLQRADPFVYKHTDGYYYFTGSHPLYDRIVLRRAKSLNDLQEAKEVAVWWKHESGPLSELIWAPEIHRANGKWYIYFAAAPDTNIDDDTFNHRMYVLENASDNPLEGTWVEKGEVKTEMSTFSLDATTFFHKGEQYYVWAQQDLNIKGHSNLYIAKMENPWTLSTKPVMLTKPELPWEIKGFWVNEGPAVLIKNGKVFLTYSGSATGVDYCMGLLTASEDADLLNPDSWTKSQEPVFQSCPENGQYGPGHNCFTESPDGKDTILVYHARNYTELVGDPLYEPNRQARAQKIEWDEQGNPIFGVPVPDKRWTPKTPEVLK
ncbi:alpha-N-arabinofuranosidase [Bacillus sp. 7586-K]|uniref:GH43 family beta-xylosidase n=1 Tax=Metabacillus niabensis TaxID=324854 RepID=A0ABT9Z927_9BACI|nr:family 43 glycosylhydrolase [Metabacillus niabensis]MDQ0228337.1 GH43 family beta-xylosidase [Metabacillus niabensis]PAD67164.1 alpha-N-arabinofuranosidase [Bacillus sp. 7586-K]